MLILTLSGCASPIRHLIEDATERLVSQPERRNTDTTPKKGIIEDINSIKLLQEKESVCIYH